MVELVGESTAGLRERKKQRTRTMLIDAAVQLCLRQGYQHTTVEQIAAAAEVSPRTFSRYFVTKDAVALTVLDDLVDAVAAELTVIPRSVPPLIALTRAHVAVLRRVRSGQVPRLSIGRLALMVTVISSGAALRVAAHEARPPGILTDIANRLHVEPEDDAVTLVTAVWSAIVATAWGWLVIAPDQTEQGPEMMADRLEHVFAQFIEFTCSPS